MLLTRRNLSSSSAAWMLDFFVNSSELDVFGRDFMEGTADLAGMLGTTTSSVLFRKLMKILKGLYIDLNKLCSMSTDDIQAMIGAKNGMTTLVAEQRKRLGIDSEEFLSYCIIHQRNLFAKSVCMNHITIVEGQIPWGPFHLISSVTRSPRKMSPPPHGSYVEDNSLFWSTNQRKQLFSKIEKQTAFNCICEDVCE